MGRHGARKRLGLLVFSFGVAMLVGVFGFACREVMVDGGFPSARAGQLTALVDRAALLFAASAVGSVWPARESRSTLHRARAS